jgi:hypothetical protein
MARRNVFDPLEPTAEPRWYVVRDRLNAVLEAWALAAGSDFKRVFVVAMIERIDSGWRFGEFSSRGGERCQIGIEAADPSLPIGYGAVHLTESPGRGDCRLRGTVAANMETDVLMEVLRESVSGLNTCTQ